jgi:tight adherence protein C
MPDLAWLLQSLDAATNGFGMRIGDLAFDRLETVLLIIALATAVLSAIELSRALRRDVVKERFDRLRDAATADTVLSATRESRWYERLGAAVAGSSAIGATEQSKMLASLAAAGIKAPGRLATYVAIKVALMMSVPPLTWVLLEAGEFFADQGVMRAGVVLAAVLFGWRLPDMVVARLAKRRKLALELGMPDALDLLVICAEAGLGIEQAIEQIAKDLRDSSPAVAEEFSATSAEMRILPDRRVALDNLAQRTGLETLRSLVSTLNQSMRYGTSLADAMRVLAVEMRAVRMSRFEERAARLPVILTMPLLLFILPALFMIVGGPAVLHAIDAFSH